MVFCLLVLDPSVIGIVEENEKNVVTPTIYKSKEISEGQLLYIDGI